MVAFPFLKYFSQVKDAKLFESCIVGTNLKKDIRNN